jgi:isoquinoline 1-oxidoreductase beta subunit
MNKWTRRAFIGVGGVAGAGLIIGIGGNIYVSKRIKEFSGEGMGDGNSVNAWIRIGEDNSITFAVPRAEMGQGVYTSVPQLIAEELEVDLSKVKVVHPQPESPYATPFIMTQKPPNYFKVYNVM